MAKVKVQVVKERKKGFIRKIVWGVIGLIGFLASLVTVIDFMSNNKGYIARMVDGIKNLFGIEETAKPQEQPKKEPVLKAEPEKENQQQDPQKQPDNNNQPSNKGNI